MNTLEMDVAPNRRVEKQKRDRGHSELASIAVML
jgi:hypothetical protein